MNSEWLHWLTSSEHARQASTVLICIGILISSCECLAIRKQFANHGLYSWRIWSCRPVYLNSWYLNRAPFLFGYPAILVMQAVCILCCLLILFGQGSAGEAVWLSILVAVSLVLSFRNLVGGDGADQMTRVILLTLCISYWSNEVFVGTACLIFIAAQGLMSYTVAGIAKACSQKWRAGTALCEIMNTQTYGSRLIATLLVRAPKRMNRVFCWSVILVETLAPLVVLLPLKLCGIALVTMIGFHVFNAVAMGLNNFVWAFVAAFPPIVFVNQWLAARF